MSLLKKVAALVLVVAAGAWAYYANTGRASMDMSARVTSGNTPFPVTLAPVLRQTIRGTATYTDDLTVAVRKLSRRLFKRGKEVAA